MLYLIKAVEEISLHRLLPFSKIVLAAVQHRASSCIVGVP